MRVTKEQSGVKCEEELASKAGMRSESPMKMAESQLCQLIPLKSRVLGVEMICQTLTQPFFIVAKGHQFTFPFDMIRKWEVSFLACVYGIAS
jgi:hypothetical protein